MAVTPAAPVAQVAAPVAMAPDHATPASTTSSTASVALSKSVPPPVPHAPNQDPVPGMRRLLLVLRRSGALDRSRFSALHGVFEAADSAATGVLNSRQFATALRRFVPEMTVDDVQRLMQAMHLVEVDAIDYADFVNALVVLSEGDSRAPRATDPPLTTPRASDGSALRAAAAVSVTSSINRAK